MSVGLIAEPQGRLLRFTHANKNMKYLLILVLTLVFLPVLGLSQNATKSNLFQVKLIFVGDMGKSDEADRFKLLLDEELQKRGFTTVTDATKADAILAGILSLRVYSDTSLARATVQLKSPEGKIIWSGDFEPKSAFFKRIDDTVKFRAQNVVDKLRKDWNKSAKEAGLPIVK